MAKLIKCSACEAEISKNAETCPQCGEPVPKGTSLFTWLVVILIGLGIFGNILPDISSSSSTQTIAPTASTVPNKPTVSEIKKKQQLKEQDTKYFMQSKEVIVEDINLKIKNKKYKEAMSITAKYLSFKGKDNDIIKMNTKIRALLIKDHKEQQAKQVAINLVKAKKENKKKEKEILKKLKKIPSSEYSKNKELYQTLLSYKPNNKKYKEKVKYYSNKLKKKEEKEALKLAIFGKKPTQSAYDGSYYAVERYLEKVARDPDSVKITNCTGVYQSDYGWLVGCTWRGKNGFGGMNADTNWFHIRQGVVVKMDKASAYSLN